MRGEESKSLFFPVTFHGNPATRRDCVRAVSPIHLVHVHKKNMDYSKPPEREREKGRSGRNLEIPEARVSPVRRIPNVFFDVDTEKVDRRQPPRGSSGYRDVTFSLTPSPPPKKEKLLLVLIAKVEVYTAETLTPTLIRDSFHRSHLIKGFSRRETGENRNLKFRKNHSDVDVDVDAKRLSLPRIAIHRSILINVVAREREGGRGREGG